VVDDEADDLDEPRRLFDQEVVRYMSTLFMIKYFPELCELPTCFEEDDDDDDMIMVIVGRYKF